MLLSAVPMLKERGADGAWRLLWDWAAAQLRERVSGWLHCRYRPWDQEAWAVPDTTLLATARRAALVAEETRDSVAKTVLDEFKATQPTPARIGARVMMSKLIPLLIAIVLSLSACAEKPSYHERIIVIDPGHGGIDPGAIGTSGTLEKEVVLRTAWPCVTSCRRPGVTRWS